MEASGRKGASRRKEGAAAYRGPAAGLRVSDWPGAGRTARADSDSIMIRIDRERRDREFQLEFHMSRRDMRLGLLKNLGGREQIPPHHSGEPATRDRDSRIKVEIGPFRPCSGCKALKVSN